MPSSEHLYRTEGIILRRHDLGETDRILTIYTRDYGKVKAVAKGVRKPSSRKAGHVELFMRADLLLSKGRTLDVVNQVEMVDGFLAVREDLMRASYAAHFVELLDAFTEEGDENRMMYKLLCDGFAWLSSTPDLQRTARYYELRLLDLAGYRPQLYRCANCDRKIEARDQYYSVFDGGVLCQTCGPDRPRSRPISLRALKVLRYMQREPFEVVEQVALGDAAHIECERILYDILTYHLERRLRSAAFLDRLRREGASLSNNSAGNR